MKKLFILVLALFLAACGHNPPLPDKPNEVYLPVTETCPRPADQELPHLPIADLTAEDNEKPDVVHKAYAASVEILKGAVLARDKLLDVYRTNADQPKTQVMPLKEKTDAK